MKHKVKRIHFLVTEDSSVDQSGEELGFVYVPLILQVALLQLAKLTGKADAKTKRLFGCGSSGLGIAERDLRTADGIGARP